MSLKTTHTVLQVTSELCSKQEATKTTGWTALRFPVRFISLPLLIFFTNYQVIVDIVYYTRR